MHIEVDDEPDRARLAKAIGRVSAPTIAAARIAGAGLTLVGVGSAVWGGDLLWPGISVAVVGLSYVMLTPRYAVWRTLRSAPAAALQPRHWVIDDQTLSLSMASMSAQMSWQVVDRAYSLPGQLVLVFGKRQFFSIPTRAMTQVELDALHQKVASIGCRRD
jgi:hypothetical protein